MEKMVNVTDMQNIEVKESENDVFDVKLISGSETNDYRGSNTKNFSYSKLLQDNIDFCPLEILTIHSKKNVVRGLHFQREKGQTKIITCISGSLFVAVVDLRVDSKTFGKWYSVILSGTQQSIYIPIGCAVGTMALVDSTFMCFCGENEFIPEYSAGIRWDDRDVGIVWPNIDDKEPVISERDKNLPFLSEYKKGIES